MCQSGKSYHFTSWPLPSRVMPARYSQLSQLALDSRMSYCLICFLVGVVSRDWPVSSEVFISGYLSTLHQPESCTFAFGDHLRYTSRLWACLYQQKPCSEWRYTHTHTHSHTGMHMTRYRDTCMGSHRRTSFCKLPTAGSKLQLQFSTSCRRGVGSANAVSSTLDCVIPNDPSLRFGGWAGTFEQSDASGSSDKIAISFSGRC
ncbi:hypothetical protein M433DRAFT_269707 [Acidomyces richmondensis BFW]|nr:MAG: hypothetical protein FE78DRAFT_419480 [Acidomyces sp. 'richmondensis']KYG45136.1 hypothetical protein M433DRAFT_269707 [Acidomyces richmondensis BFW]